MGREAVENTKDEIEVTHLQRGIYLVYVIQETILL